MRPHTDPPDINRLLEHQYLQHARRWTMFDLGIWFSLGWIAQFDLPPGLAWSWAATGALVVLTRTALLRRLTIAPEREWPLDRLGAIVWVSGLALGGLAAIGSLLVFPLLGAERPALLAMVYLCWFAGGLALNGTVPRWVYAWSVPLLASLLVACVMQSTVMSTRVVGLVVVLGSSLLSTHHGNRARLVQSVRQHMDLNHRSRDPNHRSRDPNHRSRDLAQRCTVLENALALKTAFVDATVHDLRQPVLSLGLLCHALERVDAAEAGRSIARRMTTTLEGLQQTLNALSEDLSTRSGSVKGESATDGSTHHCHELTVGLARVENTTGDMPLSGLRVMIIDDDPAVRESMNLLLGLNGAQTCVNSAPESAIAQLSADGAMQPDIVIIDYHLPGATNGIDLLQSLRLRFPGLPAVLLTGNADPALTLAAERAGAQLLRKPIRASVLVQRLVHLIASQKVATAPRPEPVRA